MSEKTIAARILQYGERNRYVNAADGPQSLKASEFVDRNSNAWLFGVIFDQGVKAERAWEAPYLLKRRLGHLNMRRIANTPLKELRKAIKGSSNEKALHRFVNNVSSWIKAAAKKLIDEYRGDAENIWSDCRTAGEIIERLDEFKGVGKKKAHMAAAILRRAHKHRFKGFDQINMAVDVHVRRVWRRLGLVKTGDTGKIHAKAAKLHPEYPGALDAPTWFIGRGWCHEGNPDCHGARNEKPCPLARSCPTARHRKRH